MDGKPIITNWIENVPVRGPSGDTIGRARVSDKGEIRAVIDDPESARTLYLVLSHGRMYDGLSIFPNAVPAVPQQPKFNQEGSTLTCAKI